MELFYEIIRYIWTISVYGTEIKNKIKNQVAGPNEGGGEEL